MSEISDKVLEVIEEYEVPKELHGAVWKAFEEGAEYGFFRAVNSVVVPQPQIVKPDETLKGV
jgi:hypothetical protein